MFYCSQVCQKFDSKHPRNHKSVTDNNYLLLADEKSSLLMRLHEELLPNSQFSQTVAKLSCTYLSLLPKSFFQEKNNVSVASASLEKRTRKYSDNFRRRSTAGCVYGPPVFECALCWMDPFGTRETLSSAEITSRFSRTLQRGTD